jgi:hypothetical protein
LQNVMCVSTSLLNGYLSVMEHGLGFWCAPLFVHFMYLICSFHKILNNAITGALYFGTVTLTLLNNDVSTLDLIQPQLQQQTDHEWDQENPA